MNFYSLSGFSHSCTGRLGGHTPGPVKVVRTVGGRAIGERECTVCGATQRMLQYAGRRGR